MAEEKKLSGPDFARGVSLTDLGVCRHPNMPADFRVRSPTRPGHGTGPSRGSPGKPQKS